MSQLLSTRLAPRRPTPPAPPAAPPRIPARLITLAPLVLACCVAPNSSLQDGARGSTAIMLERAYARGDHTATFYGEEQLLPRLQAAAEASRRDDLSLTLRTAESLLRIGRTDEAVALLAELTATPPRSTSSTPQGPADAAYTLALLRQAEANNCLCEHNEDSCVFPITQPAEHRDRAPAEAAATRLRAQLDTEPDSATTRWLYNLMMQTLGRGDDGIAPPFRIDIETDPRVRDLHPLTNITAASKGLGVPEVSGGCVFDDLDQDGWPDILVSSMYPRGDDGGQLRLFRNREGKGFEEVTDRAGLTGIQGGLNLIHADYDNDGDNDVFVLRGAWKQQHGRWPNTLLQNQGDGSFRDVTVQAGVLAFQPTQAGAWGDVDGDGWLDLFVGNETGAPAIMADPIAQWFADRFIALDDAFQPTQAAHLYRNNRDGTFTDLYATSGLDLFGWIKGATFGDYDNDGDLDLFVSRFAKSDVLYQNDGRGQFLDVTERAGVDGQLLSFATWFWDDDHDGDLDLFVAGYPYPQFSFPADRPIHLRWSPEYELTELLGGRVDDPAAARSRLYRNRGDGTFEDVAHDVGLDPVMSIMGANYDDIDGDGALDIFLGTGAPDFSYLVPNRVFMRRDAEYVDASIPLRASSLQKGHGIAFADFDRDGDQDVYVVLGGAHLADAFPNSLLQNGSAGDDPKGITLELIGTRNNRSALHTRLALRVLDEDGGTRTLHRIVSGGGSFGSSSLAQEIPLGDQTAKILSLTVTWPGLHGDPAHVERIDGDTLVLGGRYRIWEGAARAQPSR